MARRDGFSRGPESLEEIRASDRFIEQLRVSGTYEPSTRTDAALAGALLTWRDEARMEPLNPPPTADDVDIDSYAQPRRIARRAVAAAGALLALSSAAATAIDGDPLRPVRFLVDLGVDVGERIGHPSSEPSSEGSESQTLTSGDGSAADSPLLPWASETPELFQSESDKASIVGPNPEDSVSPPDKGTEPTEVSPTGEPTQPQPTDNGDPTIDSDGDQGSSDSSSDPTDPSQSTDPSQPTDTQPTEPSQSTGDPTTNSDDNDDAQGGVKPGEFGDGTGTSDSDSDADGSNANTNPPPPTNSADNPENQGGGQGENGGGNDNQASSNDSDSAQGSFDRHRVWPLNGIGPYEFFHFDHPGNSERSHGRGHAYGHYFKHLSKHDRAELKKWLREFRDSGASSARWSTGSLRWRGSWI